MRRLLLSKQALQHIALRLDEDQARSFWHQLVTRYRYDQILVADETSKNIGVLHSVRGWGQMGITPTDRDTVLTRGRSASALTFFSVHGFEDWRFTNGTFDRPAFQSATDQMLLSPDPVSSETLADRFLVLLLDNASIHKDTEYLRKLRRHIAVWFIPPYCCRLSLLDNDVVRMMRQYADYYSGMDIRHVLNDVFRRVTPEVARYCFYNCYEGCPY